jgi:phage terminase small subunit
MGLTAKHIAVLELMADPTDTRTREEKATEAGISTVTLWRLLKKPEAIEYMTKRVLELIPTARAEAYQCLIAGIRKRDRASARDMLQALGDIGSGGTTIHNTLTQTNAEHDEEYFKRINLLDRARRITVTEEPE